MATMHDTVGLAGSDAIRTQRRGGIRSVAAALVLALALLAVITPNATASILVPDRSGDLDQRANGQHLRRQHGRDFLAGERSDQSGRQYSGRRVGPVALDRSRLRIR